MSRVLIVLALLVLIGCASPTAPSAPPSAATASPQAIREPGPQVCMNCAPPTIACAGQSNAPFVCSALKNWFTVYNDSWENGQYIEAWGPQGRLWKTLEATLQKQPVAFVWWQGEAEVMAPIFNAPTVPSYRAAFADLVARVRAAAKNPALRVIVVELGPGYYGPPHWNLVDYNFRQSQVWKDVQAFAAADPYTTIIRTDDLPFDEDGTHANGYPTTYATIAARVAAAVK